MGRHARLIVPDVALHVVQRGNNRQECFHHDTDRLVYLSLLSDAAALRHCAIHAYCLMTNHIHLLLTPRDEDGCSLTMRDVGRDYAAYINRRYERTGSLWERPFKSCLVDSAAYVLACYRYIERNPVRAHIVGHPGAYRWSSYAGNVIGNDRLLTPHAEYAAVARDEYRRMLSDTDDRGFLDDIREATHAGYPMVGERFKVQLEERGARFAAGKPGPRDAASAAGAPESLPLFE
jgi:putative transposase